MHRLALLIAAQILLLPAAVYACSCGGARSEVEEYTRAAAVFEGRVQRISRLEPWWRYTRRNAAEAIFSWLNLEVPTDSFEAERKQLSEQDRYGLVVTLRVISSSKGVNGNTVDVRTGLWMGDCGYRFERGHVYRVWAYTRTGSDPLATASALATNSCTRTSEISGRGDRFRSNDLFTLAHPLIWTPIVLAGITGLAIGWLAQRLPVRRLAQDVAAWLAASLCGVVLFGVLFPVFAEGGMFAESAIIARAMLATRPQWLDTLMQAAMLFACGLLLSSALGRAARWRVTAGVASAHGLVCGVLGGACTVALSILIRSLAPRP
ncbi:MAG TPA: hypothetical protein VF147_15610 [Vicinamibacterales bacterium]